MSSYKKYISILVVVVVFLVPSFAVHASDTMLPSGGFIEKNIWYSKNPLVEGDTTLIYTVIFNPSESDLSAKVEFYDGDILLGSRTVTVASGALKSVSISWKITVGDHAIHAKILNPKITLTSGKTSAVSLSQTDSVEDKFTIAKKIIPKVEPQSTQTESSGSDIPAIAGKVLGASFMAPIEDFRTTTATQFSDNAKNEKEIIANESKPKTVDAVKTATSSSENSSLPIALKKPLQYVALFFYIIAAYVFAHPIFFYGIIVLLIFILIRFIWKKAH